LREKFRNDSRLRWFIGDIRDIESLKELATFISEGFATGEEIGSAEVFKKEFVPIENQNEAGDIVGAGKLNTSDISKAKVGNINPLQFDRAEKKDDKFKKVNLVKLPIVSLEEKSKVTKDVIEILDEINNERSAVDELSERLNYSDNKVIEDGKLNYAATVKNMLKEGEITEEEAALMTKYKSEIIPQVEKSKATDEEIAKEKEDFVKQLKKSTVDSNELPTRDERNIAKRIADHLKKPFINQLSNKELSNLIKAIDNINNGYLPHQVELILEKLDSFTDGKTIANSIEKSNLKRISQLVNRTYNTIKSKITGKETVFEMIKRTPLFNIDQILGDFKTEELFYGLLGKVAKGDAKNSFDLKTIQEKLQKAQDKVAKSEGYFKSMNPLKAKISSYKIRTYQLQLENDSNPGDKRVNPAAEYIRETIKI
jgi:hypothetical protein